MSYVNNNFLRVSTPPAAADLSGPGAYFSGDDNVPGGRVFVWRVARSALRSGLRAPAARIRAGHVALGRATPAVHVALAGIPQPGGPPRWSPTSRAFFPSGHAGYLPIRRRV